MIYLHICMVFWESVNNCAHVLLNHEYKNINDIKRKYYFKFKLKKIYHNMYSYLCASFCILNIRVFAKFKIN